MPTVSEQLTIGEFLVRHFGAGGAVLFIVCLVLGYAYFQARKDTKDMGIAHAAALAAKDTAHAAERKEWLAAAQAERDKLNAQFGVTMERWRADIKEAFELARAMGKDVEGAFKQVVEVMTSLRLAFARKGFSEKEI